MLASESLHYPSYNGESIFKQQLKNPDANAADDNNLAPLTANSNKNNNNNIRTTSTATTDANASSPSPSASSTNHRQYQHYPEITADPLTLLTTNGNHSTDIDSLSLARGNGSSVEFETSKKMNDSNNNNNFNGELNSMINESKFKASHPDAIYENFIRRCIDEIIKTAVLNGTNRSNKVVEWHEPQELKQLINLKLSSNGESHEVLLELLQKTIKYSVKTGHPYFVNQLYSGVDPYALIGQWLTDALNPSVYTYEVAPVFTLMEEEVLSEMRRIVGFPDDGHGDGIFCPGGSIANGYAISCARFKYAPETKQRGLFAAKRLIIFTSEDAHYSVEKLAMFMGMGSENVCKIATDARGKMDLIALEAQINKYLNDDCQPLMVSATAGTTVLGAFDDLNGIADLCEKYNLWMHVDAAWGGGALVSSKYCHLLSGIARSDSVTWNPHKLLTASQQCSTFLTKHKHLLSQCHSTNATYLFQKDKFYDTSYDTGDKHIQCGRRADVFKFWFMWKAKGTKGLEDHINQVFKMSEFFTAKLKERPGFELVLEEPECTNISFWYVPPSLRNMPRDEEFNAKLHKVAPKIKEQMIKKGSMMITYQPLRKLPNFFRLVLQNSCLNESDMIYFLNEIETLGSHL